MIEVLIVDDDFDKISDIIRSIKENFSYNISIKQASNVHEALELIQKISFHLLISDICMPLRNDEDVDFNGGKILLKKIYAKRYSSNVPLYIVGLTQFEVDEIDFSPIWNILKYDPSNTDWEQILKDIIFHISKIDSKIVKSKIETLFVEGPTDEKILKMAIKVFFKDYIDKVYIDTINYGGGSSWVERQITIWAKSLYLKDKEQNVYLKSVGLFDNDKAGLESINNVKTQIIENSAESKTFSLIKLAPKYAKHLVPIYKEGILLPITLEEMIAPFCWEEAKKRSWLDKRKIDEKILHDPTKWDKMNMSLKEYFSNVSIQDSSSLYLDYKMNSDFKISFAEYIFSLSFDLQKKALVSFEPLLRDIFKKLDI